MKEKTVSLVEQTANRIVEYFEKNDLKVGDKLPNEYTLAQDLEVGRSTLREAVKMLVSKNILEVRQGSGTYITSLTETVIDPLGFGEIDNHMKLTQDKEVAVLERLEKALEKEIHSDGDIHFKLDIQFHSAIAEASRNVAMQQLIPIIIQSIKLYNDFFTSEQSKANTIRAHREIVRAIKNRDAVAARDAMLLHLADNRRTLSYN